MAERSPPAEHAAAARRLIRRARAATLSTGLKSRGGWPYGSLVTVALDADLSPLMLFSTLSDHTRNLAGDARASLLIEEASRRRNPQTGPRATMIGRIRPTEEPRHRQRFLARHPDAALYADFADFGFFRMAVERIHYVGGFARAIWLPADKVAPDAKAAAAIARAEPDILRHMNEDHPDAVDHYARTLLGRAGRGWRMTGVDPDGADLARGGRFARLPFRAPARNRKDVREELVRLARERR